MIGRIRDWWLERRVGNRTLTLEQLEAIEELERRPDHIETIDKAGLVNDALIAIVFFGDGQRRDASACCAIDEAGSIRWLPEDGVKALRE
jgi:hypothetical protein